MSLLVPVVELRRRVGTRRSLRRLVPLDHAAVAGTAVPSGRPVALDLVLESVLDGVMATGTVTAPWAAACRRCDEPVAGELQVEVRELFEPAATPGDTYPIDGDHIDLEPLVRDAVLLALPLSPLCRDTCPGPDPERFPTGPPPAAPGAGDDPRWAALGQLRFDD